MQALLLAQPLLLWNSSRSWSKWSPSRNTGHHGRHRHLRVPYAEFATPWRAKHTWSFTSHKEYSWNKRIIKYPRYFPKVGDNVGCAWHRQLMHVQLCFCGASFVWKSFKASQEATGGLDVNRNPSRLQRNFQYANRSSVPKEYRAARATPQGATEIGSLRVDKQGFDIFDDQNMPRFPVP